MRDTRGAYEPYPEGPHKQPAIHLDIQELEPFESPDWVTMGSLAAGGVIFLSAVAFAVAT
ncbi:hypothetical protein [Saccharothrix sp. NRRL B-16314]|uniref:hypothetical protein n=1 Tax=Saccharothrix sp. NRRL B-16314 TaxID=1463825 RepID=UPI000526B28D|nr:hypothetical protein [Saccharothrix sp. NRRL B-16314]